MCQEERLASSSEDASSDDGSDDDEPEPVVDQRPELVVEPVVASAEADVVAEAEADVVEESPPAEADVDMVVTLLRRAQARGKGVQATEWFSMRIGEALTCLDGKVLTAEALNSATDKLCTVAD